MLKVHSAFEREVTFFSNMRLRILLFFGFSD